MLGAHRVSGTLDAVDKLVNDLETFHVSCPYGAYILVVGDIKFSYK